MAIAGLLTEVDADREVRYSAWAIRDSVERTVLVATHLFARSDGRKTSLTVTLAVIDFESRVRTQMVNLEGVAIIGAQTIAVFASILRLARS